MIKSKREQIIAAATLDYFLSDKRVRVVSAATEFQFLYYKRRADLAIHTGTSFIGCEVKSKDDNTTTLENQINDYLLSFPVVYVATEESHLAKVIKIANKRIGILCFDEAKKEMKLIRKPKKQEEAFQEFYNSSIPERIKKSIKVKNKIKSACLHYFDTQTRAQFEHFMKHRGKRTHSEDLKSLNLKPEAEIH